MNNNIYDNWERLVTAVRKREEDWELAHAVSRESSFSSVSTDFSSSFNFSASLKDHFQDTVASFSSSSPFDERNYSGESPSIPRSEYGILQLPIAMPISFNELKNATRNFLPDNILGDGKSGPVFKGWIDVQSLTSEKPGRGLAVAIRRCNHMPQFQEWLQEERLPQHPNLIKLIAYCDEGENKLLVHEFMPRRSLGNHLFGAGPVGLSWATRINVAIGAARGLSFLHKAKNNMMHGNFKSSNILLDEEFNAKLSDWGYAQDHVGHYKTPFGSSFVPWYYIFYAAPESINEGIYTKESDVYSFGIVLLELLAGCSVTKGREFVLSGMMPYLSSKKGVHKVVDSKLKGKYPHKGAYAVTSLALQCLSFDSKLRPKMVDVLAVLEQLQNLSEMQKFM